MKKLAIRGGNKLSGIIEISGAKNATLPIMVASILSKEDLTLSNIPHVSDIAIMANILIKLGVNFNLKSLDKNKGFEGKVITLNGRNINNFEASYDLVSKMRASILTLGALLARFGEAKVSLPGGCAIGTRPVDLHLKALEKMGAKIEIKNGYVKAKTKTGRLNGTNIKFDKISVGATQNILMAACLAQGKTIIENAAMEPEIIDLANCLIKMGAKISGAGTKTIEIIGVEVLNGANHHIIGDRIEAGTYAIAAAMTNGEIILKGATILLFDAVKKDFTKAGIDIIKIDDQSIKVKRKSSHIAPVSISTKEYPGFPTDMQAQFMALMTIAQGESEIKEDIFENRFMHVLELVRMGADIEYKGNIAKVKGVKNLSCAEVMATDLRASASLVLAALTVKEETIINRLYHLERGYERMAEKLYSCNADVKILY
ncbi:UDP-N-acetylglucosamine 1-carboxyvinyltransferase [Rickettsiales bacterium]|nr:UDP-N-acetylglucosamine 1-carboxyvinyltransferase [Rickettsiales bacterium]